MRDDAHAPEVGDSENDVAADEEESDKVDEDVAGAWSIGAKKVISRNRKAYRSQKATAKPKLCHLSTSNLYGARFCAPNHKQPMMIRATISMHSTATVALE